MNNLQAKILSSKPTGLLLFMDYDDCLEPSTVRNLTDKQKKILWGLHLVTNGGVIITTNSDGRSVTEMQGMKNFPVISEFATVFRNIGSIKDHPIYLHEKPDCCAAFEAAASLLSKKRIPLLKCGEELATTEGIKLEEKEMGIAAVFGKHAYLEPVATEIMEHAFKEAGFSDETHEIDYTGKDAREIKVTNAKKVDVVSHLSACNSALMNRSLNIAMGDSTSDLELMLKLEHGIIVGDSIPSKTPSTLHHFSNMCLPSPGYKDFNAVWEFLETMLDAYSKHYRTRQPAPTAR